MLEEKNEGGIIQKVKKISMFSVISPQKMKRNGEKYPVELDCSIPYPIFHHKYGHDELSHIVGNALWVC